VECRTHRAIARHVDGAIASLNPMHAAINAEMKEHLAEAISRLPPRHKQVLVLYYYDGKTLREIGGALGVSEATVCRQIEAAREALHLLLSSVEILDGLDYARGT
jgi:RNA polymerase sigma factor for flagellar operon FliA